MWLDETLPEQIRQEFEDAARLVDPEGTMLHHLSKLVEARRERSAIWASANKTHIRKYMKSYNARRLQDPAYKAAKAERQRKYRASKANGRIRLP